MKNEFKKWNEIIKVVEKIVPDIESMKVIVGIDENKFVNQVEITTKNTLKKRTLLFELNEEGKVIRYDEMTANSWSRKFV